MSFDFFDDAGQKRVELLAIYEALPTITIHGVVDARGASGSKVPPAVDWSINLELVAWRVPGAPVSRQQLSVSKIVSETELLALQNAIDSESIIAFEAKLCENSPFGDTRAQLIRLLEHPCDEELERALAQYRQPIEIVDPAIGKLVFNRSFGGFQGTTTWLGQEINLALLADGDGNPDMALRAARSLLENMAQWAARVNDYAADELLELKNDNWLDEDEQPISKTEFIDLMQLQSITVYADGEFEFWLHDGDLFWGHAIEVSGSLSEGLNHAAIMG